MAHSIFQHDYSGDLVEGVFYDITVCLNIPFVHPTDTWPPGTIVSNNGTDDWERSFIYAEVHYESHPTYGCPLDARHETTAGLVYSDPKLIFNKPHSNEWAELFGGPEMSKLVWDTVGLSLVVSREFKDEIARSPLTGFSLLPLPVPEEYNQSRLNPAPELFVFRLGHIDYLRRSRVVAPTPNGCPFCGWGPIVCPACQHVTWDCPRCKERLIVPESEHKRRRDRRFTIPGAPRRGRVIEGERWDGSDAFVGGDPAIVTGRFVEFALRCGAAPFLARPCLVDISRCSKDQIARLENVRFGK
jgi:hypothetical protein